MAFACFRIAAILQVEQNALFDIAIYAIGYTIYCIDVVYYEQLKDCKPRSVGVLTGQGVWVRAHSGQASAGNALQVGAMASDVAEVKLVSRSIFI